MEDFYTLNDLPTRIPLPKGWEKRVDNCLKHFENDSFMFDMKDALVFMAWMLNSVIELHGSNPLDED